MHKIYLSVLASIVSLSLFSQTVMVPLSKGGANNGGTVLQVNLNNGNYDVIPMEGKLDTKENELFTNDDAASANSGVYYESSNNSLYVIAKTGPRVIDQSVGLGTIFRYSLDDQKIHLIKQYGYNSLEGESPLGTLHNIGGLLYGVANEGGQFGFGCIFSIDPSSDEYNVVHSFNGTTEGGNPSCNLFVDGNLLYGAGSYGNGAEGEVYFRYDVSNSTNSVLHLATGVFGIVKGVFVHNNRLYISTGNNIDYLDLANLGAGRFLFHSGSGPGAQIGTLPYESALRTSDNQWLIIFNQGGIPNHGSIARFDFGSGSVLSLHAFQGGALGETPRSALVNGLNGDVYGLAYTGGGSDYVLYKFSSSGVYSVVHTFDTPDEGLSVLASPVLVGSKLYGISENGGIENGGTIWSYDLSTNSFNIEEQLGFLNGRIPLGGISVNPFTQQLDFTCHYGGNGKGVLRSLDPSTNTITNISTINETQLSKIYHKPFYANGNTFVLAELFQSTAVDNLTFYGVFQIDPTSGNRVGDVIPVAPVGDISNIGETIITSNVIQDGNILYGSSEQFLWKVDLSTNTASTLYSFVTNTDGNKPATIIVDNGVIYGINKNGGANSEGTVFSYDIALDNFSNLFDIANGETYSGLQKSADSLFSIHHDGLSTTSISKMDLSAGSPAFTNEMIIDAISIGSEAGPHLSIYDDVIYGIMNNGGLNNLGGLFMYDINSNVVSNLVSFNDTTGHYSYNSELFLRQGGLVSNTEYSLNTELNVYPNPSKGIFRISGDKEMDIIVLNSNGQFVSAHKQVSFVDLKEYPNGMYILQVSDNNGVFNIKILKE